MRKEVLVVEPFVERILEGLGLSGPPEPELEGLRAFYRAWCACIPFDNTRKIAALRSGAAGPLPGDDPVDFFEGWLRDGAGGTCWAGNGALAALLQALGFAVERGVGTMLSAPDLPPNHGTVVVAIDGARFLVDASILHGDPLPLVAGQTTAIDHAAWGVRAVPGSGIGWAVLWRPLHRPSGLDCRLDALGAGVNEFRDRHEATRPWSPFNYELYARRNTATSVVGIAFGKRVTFDDRGGVSTQPIDDSDRRVQLLVEELGFREEFALALPPDTVTPPPPGTRTAGARADEDSGAPD